jgi:phospholipid/cholesterol/gamma-HCH transport system substrate-binding protein
MTSSLSRPQAVLLGLVVVLGLFFGGVALFAVGDGEGLWAEPFELAAAFPTVNGVEVGTRVRVQGINAGQVIAVDQPARRGDPVLVRFRLRQRFQPLIATDAVAEIASEGLIGGKVIEIRPGSPDAPAVASGGLLPGKPDPLAEELRGLATRGGAVLDAALVMTRQATATLAEGQQLARDLRQGEGPVGKEMADTLKNLQRTTDAVGQRFDDLKRLPLVGGYLDAQMRTLFRPNQQKYPFVFQSRHLFADPASAVLTPAGEGHLAAWAQAEWPRFQVKGSELVVAAFAGAAADARAADVLTQQQADAVREYLVQQHSANKLGWVKWRKVEAVGLGTRSAPGGDPQTAAAYPNRVELLVFVPPGSLP